ncbi:MAG: UvrD-helicase domain-containing protein [Dehalococcoidia bacterium]
MDITENLNSAQKEAVEAIEGPVLVVAGPGSGKTRVITQRIAYLIKVVGISPHRILAVTFTNKAAREMKNRVHAMLDRGAEGLTLGTFHAICARILRQEAGHLGISSRFVIYDENDQASLITRSLKDLAIDSKQYPPRSILSMISAAKAELIGTEEFVSDNYFEEVARRVYERYQQLLAESNALDFDDLLMRTVILFRDHPEVLAKYQSRYLHIMIDEFQDTNFAQYRLASQLAGKYRNICVVGDPDQSIYSWRSADLRNILNFERDYPDARVVMLEQNYRSTQTILKAASHVISPNEQRKEKKLWTDNDDGELITIVEAFNEQEEAQFVVSTIERLISDEGYSMGDFALMYRTNAQSRALEEAFVRYGFPYKLVGAFRFYERREIKDVISYLRVISNPHDDVSMSRIINVPPRNIGQRTLNELSSWAGTNRVSFYGALKRIAAGEEINLSTRSVQSLNSFTELIDGLIAEAEESNLVELFDAILERTGYRKFILDGSESEERWSNILELRGMAGEHADLQTADALSELLERVALVSSVDNLEEESGAVTLITLHQAKGLEFPVVFITGMEEAILPHIRSFGDAEQMEEERRLCYVGITRAGKQLFLTRAFRRTLHGASRPNPPSRFLEDIPSLLIAADAHRRTVSEDSDYPKPADLFSFEAPDLKVGDSVFHSRFGEGVVIECLPINGDHEITVSFREGIGTKKLLLSLAPLEKML